MQKEYSLKTQKYYHDQIEMSSSPLKKLLEQHEKRSIEAQTINKPETHQYSAEDSQVDLNYGNQQSTRSYCFPKYLTWLGKVCTPCKIFCPWCCCGCCVCQNWPLFQQQVKSLGLLQEWGRYKRTLQPGLHVINPVSQSILEINQQTHILEYNQICISKDNVQFEVTVVVFYRVVDSLKVAYRMGNSHLQEGVRQIAEGLLRSVVGQNNLQTIIQNRSVVSVKFTDQMNKMMKYWGIYIEVSSLKEIRLPRQIQHALQTVAETKRTSQAMLINSQAQVSCAALYKEISEIINTKAAYQIRFLNMVEQILSSGGENVMILRTRLQDKEEERSGLGGE